MFKRIRQQGAMPFWGIHSMEKCHGCTLVINQSYWFEILLLLLLLFIKSFEGWGQVIIFLLLTLTLLDFMLVLAVFIRVCDEGASMAFCHGVYTL